MNKKGTTIWNLTKRTRNRLLLLIGVLVSLFFYGNHNFENDKQTFISLITHVANGDIKESLDKMEEHKSFSNPLVNIAYQRWKKKIAARFLTNEVVIENTSGNKIIYDISNIYREYWRIALLKEDANERTDTTLYLNLVDYLMTHKLTDLSRDSLSQTIKNDEELQRIIAKEGFKSRFIYRNGFQDIFIWSDETSRSYEVALPKETLKAKVVFIEKYHINGYDNYASMGSSQVGGWALKESATLYCNKNTYDLTSEKFMISYLKHESLHFADLNAYPNLSSSDLEYRAKVIELMYCTQKTIYGKVSEFITSADSSYRSHSHPYANYMLMHNLSQIIFNTELETDDLKWKSIPVETINNAASILYERSEETLQRDKNVNEII